jgi:predicted TIM-barrel fold metal-dependent hydrolase
MIDTHVHVVDPGLPGQKPMPPLLGGPPEALADALGRQMKEAGVTHALAMGRWDAPADDPLGVSGTLRLAALVPGLHPVGVADPTRTHPDHLRRAEAQLKQGQVKALKAYLGYLHHGPDSPGYLPYYHLAATYRLPVIFHTGDTYSTKAKVRFAHPLLVDEVAVDHPGVRFVLAHLGNPWLTDAAEVVYKNENVWADLSGLLVGDEAFFRAGANQDAIRQAAEAVGKALRYSEKPDRFLYGSDWPLVPMDPYRRFIESIVPEAHRPAVFGGNARSLFGLP